MDDSQASLAQCVAGAPHLPVEGASHPRLYRNLGPEGFREVSRDVGLDRPIPSLGCNFGDIDNDGFLDLYMGTGWRGYAGLFPNRMLKNVDGRHFEDVTMSSRTGHLRNGQGVSFADWDGDGDLDIFVEAGGLVPGDRAKPPLPEPGPRPSLAEGPPGRHPDESRGPGRPVAGRRQIARRPQTLDLSHGGQQLQLRAAIASSSRSACRMPRAWPDYRHLAGEPDDTDVSRH